MRFSIVTSASTEVLVVSPGGVGTTFLMHALQEFRRTNSPDNHDGFKHLPVPPLAGNRSLKVVYVFGDPVLATVSLFRRGYQHIQSRVIQKYYRSEFIIPQGMPLEEYLAQPRESYFYRRHLENWRDIPTPYPVLFLRYANLHEQLPTLRDFLDLPPEFSERFPPRKERRSRLGDLPAGIRAGLEKRYGSWREDSRAFPDAWVRPANAPRWYLPLRAPYPRAYASELLTRAPLLQSLRRATKKLFGR
ncbi:MAG: hypothetical protein AAFN92_11480 [Bacteroidota bacterium]